MNWLPQCVFFSQEYRDEMDHDICVGILNFLEYFGQFRVNFCGEYFNQGSLNAVMNEKPTVLVDFQGSIDINLSFNIF